MNDVPVPEERRESLAGVIGVAVGLLFVTLAVMIVARARSRTLSGTEVLASPRPARRAG